MRRLTFVAALVVLLGAASCSAADLKPQDAYKIGCPAVDAAVASGSLAGKAAVAGLKQLSRSGQLDPEPQRWVDATISLLDSSDPKAASGETKKLIIDGCAKNGYPLRNLR